jgi:hypothetical protein
MGASDGPHERDPAAICRDVSRAEPRAASAPSLTTALAALAIGAAAAFLAVIVGTAATGRRPSGDAALALPAAPATLPAGRPAPRALLGAGSCTSSGCHAAPVEGHAAWQSSYTVWAARDPHARAHAVLHEPLAQAIVAALAARSPDRPVVPAAENVACIGCHATGRGRMAAEGVGCESCHGAAGDWLVAHTLPGWNTSGNTLGLVDLADPFVAADTCAGCHVGGPPAADGAPREVSHDLIAAGHPRLAFELRSFKEAEPPHWRDRFLTALTALTAPTAAPSPATVAGAAAAGRHPDPRAPRAALDPLDEWALGRLGSLEVFLGQMARQGAAAERRRDADGPVAAVWPEFTAFDCYGCHRPALVAADQGPAANPGGLGVPRLEPLHWALLDTIMPAAPQADEPASGAATLAAFRAEVERRWWQVPDAAAVAACRDAIAAARLHGHAALKALPAGPLADRVVKDVNAADWDEAAAALAALRAIADRATARGAAPARTAPARERLDSLRELLEFPVAAARPPDFGHTAAGHTAAGRFDSPRGYDAQAVSAALRAAAAALADLP